MNEPRVEIVMPVYNGAPHLAECLRSLINQTHRNWRAVIVNNCSSDGTGAIADEHARNDDRIRVMHCPEFLNQAENYNRAVAQVSKDADYVKVMEGDNWLMEDCLERTVAAAEKNPNVGVVGSYWLRGNHVDGSGLEPTRTVLEGVEVCRLLFCNWIYLLGTPTTLLFRAKALLEQPRWFRSGIYYDDLELCIRIFRKWQFGYVHQVLAFIRDDNNGIYSAVRRQDDEPAYRYFVINEYGGEWFEGRELEEMRNKCERQYMDCLGAALLAGREEGYWKLHRQLWQANGRELRKAMLAGPLLRAAAERLLNPLTSFRQWKRQRRMIAAQKPA